MEGYLCAVSAERIEPKPEHPILCRLDSSGRPYWVLGETCALDSSADDDLTELEWNENEVRVGGCGDIIGALTHGLGIVSAWRRQLEAEYPDTAFDIVLSIDEGDEDIAPSVTLRLWAVRDHEHYILPSSSGLEAFSQPVLMEQVNYSL